MFKLEKANIDEVPLLTEISKKAFDSDILVGAPEKGGPGEYDNPLWHLKMLKEGHLFSFKENGSILGGALLWIETNYVYIGRIFIDPIHFRKGHGLKLMEIIENDFPRKEYQLDTPTWNKRTKAFYLKLGYQIVNIKDDCFFFKKKK